MKPTLSDILLGKLKKYTADLFPGYFALTMATGIVSIACYLAGIPIVGEGLFYLNIIFYGILWVLLLCRLLFYFQNFRKDFSDHARGSGFLTVVAGTNVLGTQFVVIGHNYEIAVLLYYVGIVL
ncbi:MAG TPA: C4-dicarboxylate ABC transporter, partial [Cyclobacteriaceae bacterium]|nr:C4-dicarboxylate ABC transporter [Cyclobacteriaceae bacterium]